MEMTLNLSLQECLIRGGFALAIPAAMVLINPHLIFFAVPVIVYLYITAIIHYCPVKHLWRRYKQTPDDNDNPTWDRDE
jgi:hypothetical protein